MLVSELRNKLPQKNLTKKMKITGEFHQYQKFITKKKSSILNEIGVGVG